MAAGLRKRWMTVVAIAIPLLTGISRFVVGAHYPTDVLAGWLLGVLSVLIIREFQKRVRNTLLLYGILLMNKMCKYCMNNKGLSTGYHCALTGKELDKNSDLFKYGCDSRWGTGYKECPHYEQDK